MTKGLDTLASERIPAALTESSWARSTRFHWVFLVFSVLYLTTWAGHYTSGDGAQKVAWTKAMLERQSADTDPGPGQSYSKYGVGHSLIALPAIAASQLIQTTTGVRCEAALYTLLFVLNGALLLAVAGVYLRSYYPTTQVWVTLSMLGLCTSWWPYTKLDFSEPLVTTCLLSGFVLIDRGREFLGVLTASLALTIRTDAIFPCGVLIGLLAWRIWRSGEAGNRFPQLALAGLPACLVIGVANLVRYGSFLDSGYANEPFVTPLLTGLYGILLSGGKSVFLFSPPLMLGFMGLRRFLRTEHGRQAGYFFLGVFATQCLFYAKWWDWSGDDSWGVRLVLPGVMLMCIPMVECIEHRLLVTAVAFVGLCVQLLGTLLGGLDYVLLVRQSNLQRESLYVGGTTRLDFEDIRFNPRYSQIVGHWTLLRVLLNVPPAQPTRDEVQRSGTPLYFTLPAEAWKRAAHWDPLWLARF